jgi:hypothetical protein
VILVLPLFHGFLHVAGLFMDQFGVGAILVQLCVHLTELRVDPFTDAVHVLNAVFHSLFLLRGESAHKLFMFLLHGLELLSQLIALLARLLSVEL